MHALVERFQADRDIEFHVVTGQEPELPAAANLIRHRNVDDASLLRLYQQADVLVLPLTDTTANNSLLEGMACGLPIVSTRLPAAEAYVGDAAALLIEGNDPDALADAIGSLRADSTLRLRMAAAARSRAEQLSWPRIAPQLADLYVELATGTRVGDG
jgi:glycosyltransferase involved in cell wall biosynthesis